MAVKVGKKWHSLKHNVVRPDILADFSYSSESSWTPKIVEPSKVPGCQACHQLGTSHVNARLAGTVAGLCDVPVLSAKLCRGLDTNAFAQNFPGKSMHEVLYGVPLSPSVVQSPQLLDYVTIHTTRSQDSAHHGATIE